MHAPNSRALVNIHTHIEECVTHEREACVHMSVHKQTGLSIRPFMYLPAWYIRPSINSCFQQAPILVLVHPSTHSQTYPPTHSHDTAHARTPARTHARTPARTDARQLHVIYDPKIIAVAYFEFWFWIDLVSTFPFEVPWASPRPFLAAGTGAHRCEHQCAAYLGKG